MAYNFAIENIRLLRNLWLNMLLDNLNHSIYNQ